jgi:hypothetical protein
MLLGVRKQDKQINHAIPAAHLRLRTVPDTEWHAANELCITVTESCQGVWVYVLVLQSGRIFAFGFAWCCSLASICKDHHKASKLSRPTQHADASAA